MDEPGDILIVDGIGRCLALDQSMSKALHSAIDRAINDDESSILCLRSRHGGTRYSAFIEQSGSVPKTAHLLVTDPGSFKMPSIETLKNFFNLSNSEARVASYLAEGYEIKEIAERMEVTVCSVRTYLKRLFKK